MNELADLYLDADKQTDAFQLSNETLIIELRIMGELDPMTLQTRYRIGKLHYLADRKEEAMEELGDVLAKQEKLLGFDHSEVTKTRDLLNQILAERATPVIFLEQNETVDTSQLPESNKPGFLENFQDINGTGDQNRTIPLYETNESLFQIDSNSSAFPVNRMVENIELNNSRSIEKESFQESTKADDTKDDESNSTEKNSIFKRIKGLIPSREKP